MSGKKDKGTGKKKGKGSKKDRGTANPSRKDTSGALKEEAGRVDLAKAEQALSMALRTVEQARVELAHRERDLTELLAKHGRLPAAVEYPVELDSSTPLSDHFPEAGEAGLNNADGSGFDKSNVGTDVADRPSDETEYSDPGNKQVETRALFDQKQVVG